MKTLTLLILMFVGALNVSAQSKPQAGEYQEGINALYAHLGVNLFFPDEAKDLDKSGVAYAAFSVDKMGFVDSVWMVQEFDSSTTANILETLERLHRFNQSMYKGKPIPMTYLFAVMYDNKAAPIPDLQPDLTVYDELKSSTQYTSMLQAMSLTAQASLPQFRVRSKDED